MPQTPHNPYAVLGISPTASQHEITIAYHHRVRELHPDTPGGDADLLAAVIAAYQLLRDPRRRADHDSQRRRPSPHTTPVPVRVHHDGTTNPVQPRPDLRAGPVRHHYGPDHPEQYRPA